MNFTFVVELAWRQVSRSLGLFKTHYTISYTRKCIAWGLPTLIACMSSPFALKQVVGVHSLNKRQNAGSKKNSFVFIGKGLSDWTVILRGFWYDFASLNSSNRLCANCVRRFLSILIYSSFVPVFFRWGRIGLCEKWKGVAYQSINDSHYHIVL